MSDEIIIWQTTDPLGRVVKLTQERMEHIEQGHPEFKGQENAIRQTVEKPHAIFTSKSVPSFDVYFRLGAHTTFSQLYVKVVVNHTDEPGHVTTAHLDDEFSGTNPGGVKYVNRRND